MVNFILRVMSCTVFVFLFFEEKEIPSIAEQGSVVVELDLLSIDHKRTHPEIEVKINVIKYSPHEVNIFHHSLLPGNVFFTSSWNEKLKI